jgi:hypothetical protein
VAQVCPSGGAMVFKALTATMSSWFWQVILDDLSKQPWNWDEKWKKKITELQLPTIHNQNVH